MINIINAGSPEVERLWRRHPSGREEAAAAVAEILAAVKKEGDAAVCRYTKTFDGAALTPQTLAVTPQETAAAMTQVAKSFLDAMDLAAENIIAYHRRQLVNSWCEPDGRGMFLGQLVRPLNRVGIYVPGGTAAYPSSVLMNALPARVAGVKEIVMATPPGQDGRINPHVLAAAARAGVTEIYKMGGAQAVAALAYGTAAIRPVDKIAGPGNLYVTLAKKQVYGVVDIDMLAGPSEVLIIADAEADARYIAADMLAQAEHDPLAAAVLLTPDRSLAARVQSELAAQLARLPRRETAARALAGQGAIIVTADLEEAIALANRFAPEHLELAVADPFALLGRVTTAGAVFLGAYAPEPLGDYLAGPSHVLPTGGTARFYSPLGVDTFLKRTSVISCSRELLQELGPSIIALARVEGLEAHAAAIGVRLAAEKQPGAVPAAETTEGKAGQLNGRKTGAA
ncbi:histidinol dehydrogenase, partial [Desulfotomaculum copahuensis]|uniref:histidinol dehydrogenase n=1 Tax=Desulfotomaculum copahuensis TaxID=1838280 RepID=UPI000A755D00